MSVRGIAYALNAAADFAALRPNVSWWYNWHHSSDLTARVTGMEFVPMLWNFDFSHDEIVSSIHKHSSQYLLVLNEPNFYDQANILPAAAAAEWPRYEAVAAETGVRLVGPNMNWGTMQGYGDPTIWLDEFVAAYNASHGRWPQMDYIGLHWYDYGLSWMLDSLSKYGRQIWVTEFSNWHTEEAWTIDTPAKQSAEVEDMVGTCETRPDVFRYAWFTGRWPDDDHFVSLFDAEPGALSLVGQTYVAQPSVAHPPPPPASPPTPSPPPLPPAPAPPAPLPPMCQFQHGMVDHARLSTASASAGAMQPASNAVDGNDATRWESAHSSCYGDGCFEQYIEVDLGTERPLCEVNILWEAAAASAYELQTRSDGGSWTTLRTIDDGASSGTHTTVSGLPFGSVARYLRVVCLQRALHPHYGYSIYTLQVLGRAASPSPPHLSPPSPLPPFAPPQPPPRLPAPGTPQAPPPDASC